MNLEHDPDEGVSVETDLSRTTVTLTRLRGAPVLFTGLLLGVLALANGLVAGDVWLYVFPVILGVSGFLNAVKTEVDLGPRAVTVRTLWFGRERNVDVLPYEAIREIAVSDGSYSGPTLQIVRLDGSVVTIPHGTADDLAELHRDLDARRPIQRATDPEDVAVPESLERLRAAKRLSESP